MALLSGTERYIAQDSERIDELQYRIEALCAVLGFELDDLQVVEYRKANDEGEYQPPRLFIQIVQKEQV